MGRILTAILLLLTAGAALADSNTLTQTQSFAAGLNPPESDYSIAYLSQIFGTVGTVLQGSSGQVLGKMFDVFNKGVMVAAAIYLAMTTVQIVIRAAQDGSFMGANRNVGFTLLRIAMGFALIIPSSATGYSLLQDIFMKIVVQSAGLADEVWDAGLNYLEYGGKLYIPPATLSTSTDILSSTIGSASPQIGAVTDGNFSQLEPVAQIFQDEVCMIRSSSQAWHPTSGSNDIQRVIPQYHPEFHPNLGLIYFPGLGDHTIVSGGGSINTANSTCGYAQSIFCKNNGSLCVSAASGNQPTLSEIQIQEQSIAFQALKQLVLSMQTAAQAYVNYKHPPDGVNLGGSTEFIDTNSKVVFTSILGYGNLITPYQTMQLNAAAQHGQLGDDAGSNQLKAIDRLSFINTAEAQGWIMAGGFYWNIERANVALYNINISKLYPNVSVPLAGSLNVDDAQSELTTAAQHIVGDTGSHPGYSPNINALWNTYVGAQQNNIVSSGGGNSSSSGGGFASAMANSALGGGIMNDFHQLGDTQGYNPIIVLMNEGEELLDVAVGMWIGAIVLSVALAVFAGTCDSTLPSGVIFKAALTWIKSIMMLVISLLLVPGAILAYYVPLYPFMVFTFAAVGWFLMVIEGMAAAPLICMGMTHPEGHDFLGKGEQVWMFYLGIFIRPALLVLGLIASMIVSFVAFEMMLSGFGTVLNSLTDSNGGAFSDGFLILISMVLMLVIFGMMTMELIEQCYKLTYQLPQYVMKWIGGPEMGGDYGGMASQVKGAVSAGASQIGAGIEGLDKGFGGMVGGIGEAKKMADEQKKNDKTGLNLKPKP